MRNGFIFLLFFLATIFVASSIDQFREGLNQIQQSEILNHHLEQPEPIPPPSEPFSITNYPDEYLSYADVINMLKTWNNEMPGFTEVKTYGQTLKGTPVYYFRVGTSGKPKILIHAGIHGDEKLSVASTMWIIQKLISDFKKNDEATWVIENRDIYFVPIVSPDSYLGTRHVEGVDPNRNFPHPNNPNVQSVSPVARLRELYEQHKFVACLSGHNWGEVYFWPFLAQGADRQAHQSLVKKMQQYSRYNAQTVYNHTQGCEVNWYYWKGSVAFVVEFGEARFGYNQPKRAIAEHGSRNYGAYLTFIKEAPNITLTGIRR